MPGGPCGPALRRGLRQVIRAEPLDGPHQPGRLDGQGGADVAVGGPAEAEAGRGHDVGLVEQPGAEGARRIAPGTWDPDVEGRLGGRDVPAESPQTRDEGVATLLVEGAYRWC